MEPTTLTIEVTQELIDSGCHQSDNCPMATALQKALLEWIGYPDVKIGPIYDTYYTSNVFDTKLLANWGLGVGSDELHVYLWPYVGARRNSPAPLGFDFNHAAVTNDWVQRYDKSPLSVGPIRFDIPITEDMKVLRNAFREVLAQSDYANASTPTD